METVCYHGKTFAKFICREEIDAAVKRVAAQLRQRLDSQIVDGQCPIFVAVLNGAFVFAADLLREYASESELNFVKYRSYSGEQSGEIAELLGVDFPVSGKHIVIIEDIIDTGKTALMLQRLFEARGAASVTITAMFLKPDRVDPLVTDAITGISIPDAFVIGYGLDYDGRGRQLSELYQLKQ